MKLYKYTTYKTGLDILSKNKFRYTQPSCFNDPFELFPVMEESITEKQLDDTFESIINPKTLDYVYDTVIKNNYNKLNNEQKSLTPYDQFYKILKKKIEQELEESQLSIKDLALQTINRKDVDMDVMMKYEYLKIMNTSVGIFCLAKNYDNILMWSHYCNSHTGIVLEINTNNSFFEHLNKIDYPESNARPRLKLSKRDYTKQESEELLKQLLYSKSILWSYEEEYRDYKQLALGEKIDKTDELDFPIYLFDFPKEIISGVYFGVRVNDNKYENFRNTIECKYSNLTFKRATLNENKFSMDFVEV